jgi:quercetin dioxygenase-like cupin family protein
VIIDARPFIEVIVMVRNTLGFAVVIGALLSAHLFAQATTQATGDPDPGVHFLVIVDNPSVRVLQVVLQPGAVRRQHVHNDVTFHMLIPVTGTLELTADGLGTINAVPGQAYYMVKGQPHGFTNKGGAAVQVVEVFVKGPAPAPWDPNAPLPVTSSAVPGAPATPGATPTVAAPAPAGAPR